jgi:hypothetical protein
VNNDHIFCQTIKYCHEHLTDQKFINFDSS